MTDFQLVETHGWDCDLQSVYSAYIGYFQHNNINWYERSWGHLFESFDDFLAFEWPAITVTDSWTRKAHIVTRMTSVNSFSKMMRTRFGEPLPVVENILMVSPFETTRRPMQTIGSYSAYRRLHSTLSTITLVALRARIKAGDPKAIRDLWRKKDRNWISLDFKWSEKNPSSCLEWGYAVVRCPNLDAAGVWPPVPEENYRKGHFVTAEYADKLRNKLVPTRPWNYAFGDTQVASKTKIASVLMSLITSLQSPDSDVEANNLIIVGHDIHTHLKRFDDLKIKIPKNVLVVDTALYERSLFASGERGPMVDPRTQKSRLPNTTISLHNLLRTLAVDPDRHGITMHNSGNDSFMTLFALQKLLDPSTKTVKARARPGLDARGISDDLFLPNRASGLYNIPNGSQLMLAKLSQMDLRTPSPPALGRSENRKSPALP